MVNQAILPIQRHRHVCQTVLVCLLVLAAALGWPVEARTQDLAADRAALVALYNATGGPNWTNKSNWLSAEPIGNWEGVTVTNERVTGLSLRKNQLTGTIPAELGNLTGLQKLNLHVNQLTGPFRPSWATSPVFRICGSRTTN